MSLTWQEKANRPGRVYRCLDADGRILYVGSTSMTVERRMSQHRRSERSAKWVGLVADVVVTEYRTIRLAQRYEALIIRCKRPLFCVHNNPDWYKDGRWTWVRRPDAAPLEVAA